MLRLILTYFFMVNVACCSYAQFNTAIINTNIDANEYGIGNVNWYPSAAAQWYVTWDASFIYISIQNANETEAAIMYFDVNPILPVNGGNNGNGNLNGLPGYDNLTPRLPFRADAAVYVKNNWRSLLVANGTGGWTVVSAGNSGLSGLGDDYVNGYYASNDNGNGAGGDDRREMRIAWSALTSGGSIPASFNMNGYMAYTCSNTCGGMYAALPSENPTGSFGINATPNMVRYFNVGTTANGSATPPFSRNCYTYINSGANTILNFGFISVWDFTMNTPGDTIVRSNTTGGDWYIGGSLIVNRGAIYFGPIGGVNYGESYVNNVRVYTRGTLDLDYTNKPLRVSGDLELRDFNNVTDSIVFELSQTIGGDLWISGNLTDSSRAMGNNGKTYRGFGPRDRQVWFRGTALQNIYSYNNDLTFDYVKIDNPQNVNLVTGKVSEFRNLDLTNGHLILNNNDWILENVNATINFSTTNSIIVTNGLGYLVQKQMGIGGKMGPILFPIGNATNSYRPATIENTTPATVESIKARVLDGALYSGTSGAPILTSFVNKTWLVQKSTNAMCNIQLQYAATDELPGFNRNMCSMMYQAGGVYTNAAPFAANALGVNPYTVLQSGITTTDTFSIASTNPLGIEWLLILAKKKNSDAIVEWQVANELHTTMYEVQRSMDGLNFYTINTQQALHTGSMQSAQYTITDKNVANNHVTQIWYRVTAIATDGSVDYSAVRQIKWNDASNYLALAGYHGSTPLFNIHSNSGGVVHYSIVDAKGSTLSTNLMEVDKGDNIFHCPQILSQGVYLLRVVLDDSNLVLRFYKN